MLGHVSDGISCVKDPVVWLGVSSRALRASPFKSRPCLPQLSVVRLSSPVITQTAEQPKQAYFAARTINICQGYSRETKSHLLGWTGKVSVKEFFVEVKGSLFGQSQGLPQRI